MSGKQPSFIDPEIERGALGYLDLQNLSRDTPERERDSLLGAVYFLLQQREAYLDILTQVNNAHAAKSVSDMPKWLQRVRKAIDGFYGSKEAKKRNEVLSHSTTDVTARVEWPSTYDAIPIPLTDPFWAELQEYIDKEAFNLAYNEPFHVVTRLGFIGKATVFIIGTQSGQTFATISYPPLDAD